MPLPVTLIPGDGIGPEVVAAAVEVIEAAGARIDWQRAPAGAGAIASQGTPLPQETLESIRRNHRVLKGPLASAANDGHRSVTAALRKEFDLFASVRPARSFAGLETPFTSVDLVVVRESTQGAYSGIEHFVDEERSAAESISIVTRKGSERVVEYAFAYAARHGRRKVTLVHKANVLRATSALFLEAGRAVAARHPAIVFDDVMVGDCALRLVTDPAQFDVLVTTNLFGDILSDLAAGLVGGLFVSAGASVGQDTAIFETAHGTAPDLAGKGLANPAAAMLAGVQLLAHAGEQAAADKLAGAIRGAIASRAAATADLGGRATTRMFTDAVLARL